MPAHRVHLLHRALYRPQRWVRRPVGLAAAKLVEKNHAAFVAQLGQGSKGIVREAGATVQGEQRRTVSTTGDVVIHIAAGNRRMAAEFMGWGRHGGVHLGWPGG